MKQALTVWDVFVMARCHEPHTHERVAIINVTKSDDGVNMSKVCDAITLDYSTENTNATC